MVDKEDIVKKLDRIKDDITCLLESINSKELTPEEIIKGIKRNLNNKLDPDDVRHTERLLIGAILFRDIDVTNIDFDTPNQELQKNLYMKILMVFNFNDFLNSKTKEPEDLLVNNPE